MSTPQSLSPAPLHSLADTSAKKLIEDDFSTGKSTLKVKASTQGSGVANYKGTLNMSFANPTQETKFQFPYDKYYFWFATRTNETKVHVDFGKYKLFKEQNIFANVQFFNDLNQRPTIRLGTVYEGAKCLSHARLEYVNLDRVNALIRTQVKSNNWIYVVASQASITQQQLDRLDLLVGYQQQNYDVFFRHLTLSGKQKKYFNVPVGKFVVDWVYRNGAFTYGVEAQYQPVNAFNFLLAAATKQKGVDLKARYEMNTNALSLSAKGKLNNKFSWGLVTAVPVNGAKPRPCGVFPLPVGFTLETTI